MATAPPAAAAVRLISSLQVLNDLLQRATTCTSMRATHTEVARSSMLISHDGARPDQRDDYSPADLL